MPDLSLYYYDIHNKAFLTIVRFLKYKEIVTIQQNIFKKHLTRFFDGKSDSIGYRRAAV
jgi:hypothetical protein